MRRLSDIKQENFSFFLVDSTFFGLRGTVGTLDLYLNAHGDCTPSSWHFISFFPFLTLIRSTEIVPSLLNSPIRQYPLRQLTEPPVYVMGEKTGQKVYPPSAGPPPPQGPMGMNPQGMGMAQPGMGIAPQAMNPQAMGMAAQGIGMTPQAMLAQQNSNMESLERRRERERARERSGSTGTVRSRARWDRVCKLTSAPFLGLAAACAPSTRRR